MDEDLSDVESDHRSRSDNEANNSIDGNESANENAQKNDNENEDGTGRRIDPATSRKRIIRNPIPKLNTARLRGPKGVHTIEKYFENFKFNGKGHEKSDLNKIMKRLEHWAHRLFPKYQFDDFLEKVETLGTKRDLQTFLTKYRQDMLSDDIAITDADGEVAVEHEPPSSEPVDEFDLLIAEQIEKNKQVAISQSNTVNAIGFNATAIPTANQIQTHNKQSLRTATNVTSNEEIKKRIERNRQLAIERRLARLKRDEQIKKNRVEHPTFDEIVQTPNAPQIGQNNSIIKPDIIVDETFCDSNEGNNNSAVNSKMDSSENSMSKNNSITTNELASNKKIPSKPPLTDEQLNKTIDDAVNQFMNQKYDFN